MRRWLNYIAWPTLTGLAIAVAIITLLPQFSPQLPVAAISSNNTNELVAANNSNWLGPVSYAEAVKRAAPSVVNISSVRIEATKVHPFFNDPVFRRYFNSSPPQYQQRLQSTLGSGVIISEHGFLLTNKHVIRDADRVTVSLIDGREAIAQIVGTDDDSDLAVLKIDLEDLRPITIGMPDEAQVGDVVLAIGNPFGIGQSVSQGIISAKNRIDLEERGIQNFMQTDATINPGNSGGALVDAYGNLLGINTLVVNDSSSSSGVSFAIPANVALTVLARIIEFGEVVQGYLGVAVDQLTLTNAKLLNLSFTDGLLVTGVESNSPAFQAGLQPNDVITQINRQPAVNLDQVIQQISRSRPGASLEIEVWRNGRPYFVTAIVGRKQKPDTPTS